MNLSWECDRPRINSQPRMWIGLAGLLLASWLPGCAAPELDRMSRPWARPTKYEVSQHWWLRDTIIQNEATSDSWNHHP